MNLMNKLRMSENLLTLNVMDRVARRLHLDLNNDTVTNELYCICCDLNDWPEDQGFGSSDHYSYVQEARSTFHLVEPATGF